MGVAIGGPAELEQRVLASVELQLAARLGVRVLTTDHRLARATPLAEAITGPH